MDLKAMHEQRTQLKEELKNLQVEHSELQEEIKKLHNDDYILKLARKEYFLSGEGEVIFVLPEK